MTTQVILAVDIIRPEEKMLWHSLQTIGVKTKILNIKKEALPLGKKKHDLKDSIALIRPVSMYRAVYTAIALETNNSRTINNSQTILLAGDKIQTYKKLLENNLPIPDTTIALTRETALQTLLQHKKPVIDKTPIGSWGRMVSLIKNNETAKIVVEHREMLQSTQTKTHIIQEYIPTNGEDIRCFVIGQECIGCIKRKAQQQEWRSNVALGAHTEPIHDPIPNELAIKASQAIKADYASIDLFYHKEKGYLINEINGVPEFKVLSHTLKINVASELVSYLKKIGKK